MDANAHIGVGHADHHFEPAQAVARGVGVDGGQRAVVAGVHGLQHVQGFFRANFADDDAVGPHTEGVDDQLPDVDRADAFHVGRARFHARHVRLLQPQFGGVFNGDDALVFRNVGGERVEQGGFAGAGASADQDVQARFDAAFEQLQHAFGEGELGHQVFALQGVPAETADARAAVHPPPPAEWRR